MNKFMPVSGVVLSVLVLLGGCAKEVTPVDSSAKPIVALTAPVAKKVPYEMTVHGDTRVDDYYWMRDDSRTNVEVLAHLQAEEDYLQQSLAHTADLQKTLFDEMTSRLQEDESSVPVLINGYYYQRKYIAGGEYAVNVRVKDVAGAAEEVLLDGNALAKGHEYFNIGDYNVSTNNNILAYSVDTLSRRIYNIVFKNLETGELLGDELAGTNGQVIWANDSKTVFYVLKDLQTLLGYKVMRHTLGTPQSDDVLMYEQTDNTFSTYLGKSIDDKYIVIVHYSTLSKGMSVLSADNVNGEFKVLHALQKGLEYSASPHGNDFYILNNDNATNFKISKASSADVADKSKWQDVIAHDENTLITDMLVLKDALLYTQRSQGLMSFHSLNLSTGKVSNVAFDDSLFTVSLGANYNFAATAVRVEYDSMTTPSSVYDINLDDLSKTLLKQDVVNNYDASLYESKRIMLAARDGKQVPVSILYKKSSFKQDGTNPLLQYAYSSYGSTNDPYLSTSVISLLDRGFVYAVAHVRGSEMLGRAWYEDGKLLTKKNTFNDFVDVTKGLVAQKYGAKDKIFALGGSAGGLLMGGIVNQAPELYLGVVAAVPFVDVITTMLDESIPLTTGEFDEWGNPKQKQYYDYMLSYSPYDNVTAQDYPNLLVTTGLHDSQVQYFEPAKWVAKLRDMKTDNNQLLFNVNMGAGHGGASGRYKRYELRALMYTFMLDLLE
ncbi:S9 family peptidase [Colwelliaceae bacterium BS250]